MPTTSATIDPIERQAIESPLAMQMPPADPLGQTSVRQQLAEGRLGMHWGSAQVTADPPSKVSEAIKPNQPTAAMGAKLDTISRAQHEVAIVNPYFVPGEVGMRALSTAERVAQCIATNRAKDAEEQARRRKVLNWGKQGGDA